MNNIVDDGLGRKRSRKHLRAMRKQVSWLHYARHATRAVADTENGRNTLVAMMAGGESRRSIMNRAPWQSDAAYDALYEQSRRMVDTPALGTLLGELMLLTEAERTKWKLWHLWPDGVPRADVQARLAAARKARARAKQSERLTQIMQEKGPTMDLNNRERLLLTIIGANRKPHQTFAQGHWWPVPEVVAAVTNRRPRQLLQGVPVFPRDFFTGGKPMKAETIERTVRCVLDSMEARGIIESQHHAIKRGLVLRVVRPKLQSEVVPFPARSTRTSRLAALPM